MITPNADWQRQLAEAFSHIDELCHYLQLTPSALPLLHDERDFPLRVPRAFADCMQAGNPDDPLLRQVLPIQAERQIFPGFVNDPVGDLQASPAPGVIHKYHGRLLLIVTGACAVHCRYCFRRHFPYAEQQLSTSRLEQALAYIAQQTEISEVILSGGDPLLLQDDKFNQLLGRLCQIPQVQRIRIHSRLPIVLPARITPTLLEGLRGARKPIVLVCHANHPNELSLDVRAALHRLRLAGITLLNQSVLLAGVNDAIQPLADLSQALFAAGVLPYYLHLLDRAQGCGHFEVEESQARQIHQELQRQLPGYLLPRLVREVAGAAHKIALC